ncbi:alpha/beta fold hydrolase [Xanthobacter sp. YC-JY1]|uniref:alpha/beta fold hydrolase n=1 Tax=Xanthobacter sp. YC-JY1 TaxID=2419844 RepID=UPI001F220D98|nr:alpha/beta hydrolase [Xanthobacter sp. YC-JY1]UJX43844.1 alpha/beta hydrolase [Xanthobacter sp. YC-JY1]
MANDKLKPGPPEHFTSKDGTPIAFERWGSGPAVVLVDGAFCSRRFGPTDKLAPLLAQHFTVFAYDRRGRGDSGDVAPYSISREIEDLAALIAIAGGSARVFGMSSGAVLALEAAASGVPMDKLSLYEAPYLVNATTPRAPADYAEQLQAMLDADDRGSAVKFYMTEVMQMPRLIVAIMPLTPNWKQLKASAPSLLHEATLMGDFHLPRERFAQISVPTLALAGSKGPELMREAATALASALPSATSKVLSGQSHDVSMPVLAPVLEAFFST